MDGDLCEETRGDEVVRFGRPGERYTYEGIHLHMTTVHNTTNAKTDPKSSRDESRMPALALNDLVIGPMVL